MRYYILMSLYGSITLTGCSHVVSTNAPSEEYAVLTGHTARKAQPLETVVVPQNPPSSSIAMSTLLRKLAADEADAWGGVRLERDYDVLEYERRGGEQLVTISQSKLGLREASPAVVRLLDARTTQSVRWSTSVYSPAGHLQVRNVYGMTLDPSDAYLACLFAMGIVILDLESGPVVRSIMIKGGTVECLEWGKMAGEPAFRAKVAGAWGPWCSVTTQ